jgi:hypothetical protein
VYDLSNHHECRLCSFDDDEDVDDEDDDADRIGNFNDVSSSVLWLCRILWTLCCDTSKQNNLLKNSYDAKKIAP